ncbi:hypothetical protein G5I_08703 [Acromyrmex echinatior]|uniref:Uncharacterized protein n=1 Tax=Acromyrmex echinatior TaxID=103372 RepID=F4WS87_ACREC|nr:hypothetical protein G5I_08703 [Acromyrmex echinatior]
MPKIPGSILVRTKIFTLVSPLEKSRQPPESILAHLSKNPPFTIGNKTVDPICSWQLNNQRAHYNDEKLATSINHSVTNDRVAFILLQVDDRVRSPGTSRSCLTVTTMSLSISPSSPEEPVTL